MSAAKMGCTRKDFSWGFSHAVGQGCSLIWRLTWKRILFQAHSHGCWQNLVSRQVFNRGHQILASWLETSCMQFLDTWTSSKGSITWQLASLRVSEQESKREKKKREREQKRALKVEPKVFLQSNLTNNTLLLVLQSVRSDSLGPAYSQGENIT